MLEVTWPQVLACRMAQQSLAPRTSSTVNEIVRRTAGIRVQVRSSRSSPSRSGGRRRSPVDRALWRDRSIVKMWAMRRTLHLLPADGLLTVVATLRTLHPWTAPSWERDHDVKAAEVERVREAIGEVPTDGVLWREELAAEVAERVRSKWVAEKLGSGWGELLKPALRAARLG